MGGGRGMDGHTMAAYGAPVNPDPHVAQPCVCPGNTDGTCPDAWIRLLTARFEEAFDHPLSVNDPFRGGYIFRTHTSELPWVQLELSRVPFKSNEEKCTRVVPALRTWCNDMAV